MKPVFFTRGLCAAALLLSLAACGGDGSGTDAGALAATPASTAQKPDGSPATPSTADASTADTASSPALSWAP